MVDFCIFRQIFKKQNDIVYTKVIRKVTKNHKDCFKHLIMQRQMLKCNKTQLLGHKNCHKTEPEETPINVSLLRAITLWQAYE